MVIVVFGFVTAFFFSPAFFGDKTLSQSDIIGHRGASKEIIDHREATGEEALWTNSMFGGMPAYQISTKHNSNIIDKVNKLVWGVIPHPYSSLFIAFCCFYGLMLVLRVPPLIGALGAIAFGLSSYNIQLYEAGHNSKMAAIAYMPMVLGGILLVIRDNKKLLGLGIFSFFLTLELSANHLQITYYLAIALAIVLLAFLIHSLKTGTISNALKSFALLLVGGAIALACNASNLWTTYEYKAETIRGKSELTSVNNSKDSSDGLDPSYITAWSYQKSETFNLLIPNFKGGGSGAISNNDEAIRKVNRKLKKQIGPMDLYFGGQPFTSGPTYIGAAIIFLALIGAVLYKGWLKWPLIAAMCLAIMLSWGKFFMGLTGFFIDVMPLYSNFRAPAMILVVVQLSVPVLAVLGLSQLWKIGESKAELKKVYWTTGVVLGLLLFFLAFPDASNSFYKPMDPLSDSRQVTIDKAKKGVISLTLNDRTVEVNNNSIKSSSVVKELLSAVQQDTILNKKWNAEQLGNILKLNAKGTEYKGGTFALEGAVKGSIIPVTEKEELSYQLKKNRWRKADAEKFLKNLEAARKAVYSADVQRSFAYILIAFIAIALIFHTKLDKRYWFASLLIIVFADLWQADARYLGEDNYAPEDMYTSVFNPSPADLAIEDSGKDGRVLNLAVSTFNDATTSYMHHSVGGYSAVKLRRYQEYYENALFNEFTQLKYGLEQGASIQMMGELPGINMLNTTAVIFGNRRIERAAFNPSAYGKLWFVDSLVMAENADEELAFSKARTKKEVAVISEEKKGNITARTYDLDSTSSAELVEYAPNFLRYQVKTANDACVVFSEIFYDKGWLAKIDGKEVEIARANYLLRALEVPAGEHEIEFSFEPKSYVMGSKISLGGSLLVLALLILGLVKHFKSKKQEA